MSEWTVSTEGTRAVSDGMACGLHAADLRPLPDERSPGPFLDEIPLGRLVNTTTESERKTKTGQLLVDSLQ